MCSGLCPLADPTIALSVLIKWPDLAKLPCPQSPTVWQAMIVHPAGPQRTAVCLYHVIVQHAYNEPVLSIIPWRNGDRPAYPLYATCFVCGDELPAVGPEFETGTALNR